MQRTSYFELLERRLTHFHHLLTTWSEKDTPTIQGIVGATDAWSEMHRISSMVGTDTGIIICMLWALLVPAEIEADR